MAKACVDGDLDAFAAAAGQLGWTLDEEARVALLHAVRNTNHHHYYSYGVQAFTLAQAIGLLAEAAHNESGIAVLEQPRNARLGKEIALAFRYQERIYFGVRYASNLPMGVSTLWPELKPWFKQVERNRARLEVWAKTAAGVVSVPLAKRSSSPTSKAELLAAIIAEPDEVEHRLVYADYLVAHGDAQGELIQLCERRREQPDPALDERIAQLEQAFGARIAGKIAQLASSYTIIRGFVTDIEMSAPTFAKHGERLLASHPIERLELEPVNDKALARLAKAPALKGLRNLQIGQLIGHERPMSFDELCRSPHFDSLRCLEVRRWQSSGEPGQAFAQLRAPRLQSMVLYRVDSAVQILAGLAGNESVQLQELEISHHMHEDWAVDLSAPAFAKLAQLRLDAHGRGVGRMFERPCLPALTNLELGDRVPLEPLNCPNLRRLLVAGTRSDARSLIAMIERHPKLEAVLICDMDGEQAGLAYELALALPPEHPLRSFEVMAEVDPALDEQVKQRFPRPFFDPPG